MKVLISGASIAGPAVAYWLSRQGHDVTVVEQAAEVRAGRQAVDFKGTTHRLVLERMGLWDEIQAIRTAAVDQHIVDASNRVKAVIPHEFTGGDVEVLRGDLGRLMYDRTAASRRAIVAGASPRRPRPSSTVYSASACTSTSSSVRSVRSSQPEKSARSEA